MPAIETKQLTKRYGDLVAVDRLDMSIKEGEVFGLLGPNGAGKTTTILMLLGLTEPTSGQARVAGLDPVREPLDVKRVVGYLPDNVGFYGDLSGRDNLAYTARLNRLPRDVAESRIASLLERVDLTGVAGKDVSTYSRGMRQRLGIADALIKEPRVLILDEPTIGLDPEGAQETLRLIRDLARGSGVAVLLSSHLLYQVQAICDRVAIFVQGKVVVSGRLEELAARVPGRHVEVEVGVRGGVDVREVLQRFGTVEREADFWVVTAEREMRDDVAAALLARGVAVTHMRRRGAELDEIYRRYFDEH